MQACDRCHRRKSRCDKGLPACGHCTKARAICLYSDRTKPPSSHHQLLERTERRLRQKEAECDALLKRLEEVSKDGTSSDPARERSLSPASPQPVLEIGAITAQRRSHTQKHNDTDFRPSFMSLGTAADALYFGSASGNMLADMVRSTIEPGSSDVTSSNIRSASISATPRSVHEPASPRGKSFAASMEVPVVSEMLARDLIDNYFGHEHLSYPFLHPSEIRGTVDRIYFEDGYYAKNAIAAFAFDMILAIATANSKKFDWQQLPGAEIHHERALSRLNTVLGAGGFTSLQAILLMCLYRMSSAIQDTSSSLWHLVGVAVRIAIELGLHQESTYTTMARDNGDVETASQISVRRKTFWCVISMDRIASRILGRPTAIDMDFVDVNLPDASSASEMDEVNPGSAMTVPATTPSGNHTAVFVHIVRYRIICGKILHLHLRKPNALIRDNDPNAESQRSNLLTELKEWSTGTQVLHLPLVFDDPHRQSCYENMAYYDVLYHNAVLLLYLAPHFMSCGTRDAEVLQTVFNSAKRSITAYSILHRLGKINHSWITLHAVFLAGLSYIYAVRRHFQELSRDRNSGKVGILSLTTMELVNDTRSCSKLLAAISERWRKPRHPHELFDRLSDAILSDALGESAQQQAASHSHLAGFDEALARNQPDAAMINSLQGAGPAYPEPDWTSSVPYNSMHLAFGQEQLPYDTSLMSVDNELRNSFCDIQLLYNRQYLNDQSLQLSAEWLEEIEQFGAPAPALNGSTG